MIREKRFLHLSTKIKLSSSFGTVFRDTADIRDWPWPYSEKCDAKVQPDVTDRNKYSFFFIFSIKMPKTCFKFCYLLFSTFISATWRPQEVLITENNEMFIIFWLIRIIFWHSSFFCLISMLFVANSKSLLSKIKQNHKKVTGTRCNNTKKPFDTDL